MIEQQQETHFIPTITYTLKVRGWEKRFYTNVNQKKAFEILQPLIQNVDFAKNGAFAYAVLLEEGMGGEVDILDIMHYYSIAAEKALSNPERKVAKERVNNYYEKFYK